MKKSIFCLLLTVTSALVSCDPDKLEVAKTNPESGFVAPVMNTMSQVQISQANYDNNTDVTFTWKDADFGVPSNLNYSLFMSSESHPDMLLVTGVYKTSYTIDTKTLYAKLIGESNLGLSKGKVHSVKCYVTASFGDNYYVSKSEPVAIDFNIARISTGINMLYISGDFNGNHPDKHGIEETTPGSKQYEGLVNMKKAGMTSTNVHFIEYTYAGTNEGDVYGDNAGALAKGGADISTTADLAYVRVDLNAGTYSITTLPGNLHLVGFNGSWSSTACPQLVYIPERNVWEGTGEYKNGSFRIISVLGWSWAWTFGPKTINELTCQDGSDIKIYHNDIAKKYVGGDANWKMRKAGTYVYTLYYESADCTWHVAMKTAK